jgi:hypothetical protein
MDFLLGVVRDEDYATGQGVQRGLRARPDDHVLFGRNESGGQRFHRWVDAVVDAPDRAGLAAAIAEAEVVHQP